MTINMFSKSFNYYILRGSNLAYKFIFVFKEFGIYEAFCYLQKLFKQHVLISCLFWKFNSFLAKVEHTVD